MPQIGVLGLPAVIYNANCNKMTPLSSSEWIAVGSADMKEVLVVFSSEATRGL
jgi:hypothetical protein